MRIKNVKFLPMAFAALLFSCQQEEMAKSEYSNEIEMSLFDLQEFTYKDVKELLSNQEIVNIQFKDGDIVRDVKRLKKTTGFELLGDDEQAANTLFFEGAPEDSISVIMDGTYASIKMIKEGREFGYVAFVAPEAASRAINTYMEEFAETRAAGVALPITRSAGRNALRFDFTEIAKSFKGHDCENAISVSDELQTNTAEVPSASTRTAYYTQWPRGNTLTIHLIRDKRDTPLEYELNWQVNEMVASIRNISMTYVKVWRSNTGYYSSSDKNRALSAFRDYCHGVDFPWKESVDHDAIFLVNRSGWRGLCGQAWVDTYKLNRYWNSWAYGIAGTSALFCPRTLTHEVGHMLGANHVSANPWWKFWAADDVMVPQASFKTTYRHFNGTNRNTIWNNLNN